MAPRPTPDDQAAAPPPGSTVHQGLDGWLFLVGGSNRPLAGYGRSPARWWRLRRWAWVVRARERRCLGLGARYLHVVVPEKLSVYPEMAPALGIDPERAPARALARLLPDSSRPVDAVAALVAGKPDGDMYMRTDTHWTLAGCHRAYLALAAACGVARPLLLAERPHHDHVILGDLGEKLSPPPAGDHVRRYTLQRDAVRIHASPLVQAYAEDDRGASLHRGAHVVYRNDAPEADRRRVVLFGDSCAHFEPFMLTGMLAETFRELHFIWSASIDWGYVRRVAPDLVIGEIAERFMFKVPTDRYDVEAFTARRLRTASA